jgi:hypothetical protein
MRDDGGETPKIERTKKPTFQPAAGVFRSISPIKRSGLAFSASCFRLPPGIFSPHGTKWSDLCCVFCALSVARRYRRVLRLSEFALLA